ncbi:DUF6968 family protein [Chromobacterium haemolyticum]|uniref:DUF6968 family protein n=1 Tax=Chromobacterium haemolyticum TaxID=394935 RepID=UPI001130DE72|nr:hypothetical protein [Chromobacterium haemolyticum]
MEELKPIPDSFTIPIASRDFVFVECKMSSRILVEIGAPIRDVETVQGMDWRCPVRFSGEKIEEVCSVCGIDSFQSLCLAFRLVRYTLEELERSLEGKIRFLESDFPPFEDCEPLPHDSDFVMGSGHTWPVGW